jgi:hypothetical protein
MLERYHDEVEEKSSREERVFLVRMWIEPHDVAWRGSVQDVTSGRRLYVSSPSEVADFIAGGLPKAGGPAAD